MEIYDVCGKIVGKMEFLCVKEICDKVREAEDSDKIFEEVGIILKKYDFLIKGLSSLSEHVITHWSFAEPRIRSFVWKGATFKSLYLFFEMGRILESAISDLEAHGSLTCGINVITLINDLERSFIRSCKDGSADYRASMDAIQYIRRLVEIII